MENAKIRKAALALLALGLVISAYLVYVHFNATALVCPNNGFVSCETVLASTFSEVLGIPLAVYAFAWFIVALLLEYYRKRAARVWAAVGIAGFAYSVVAMYLLGKICLYCSTIDAILLIYFVIAMWRGDA